MTQQPPVQANPAGTVALIAVVEHEAITDVRSLGDDIAAQGNTRRAMRGYDTGERLASCDILPERNLWSV